MPNVVDTITIKIAADTKGLKKGLEDAKKSLGEFDKSAKSTGETLNSGLAAGASRATGSLGIMGSMLRKGGAIGIGLGAMAYLIGKVDEKLLGAALNIRHLGIDAKNLGISGATGLRNIQNAAEMMGGSVGDATQTVNDLQKSLFNLRFNGQVSESLVMLQRLGVQYDDAYGRARDFNDVLLDTADALEAQQKSGLMTRAEAFQFAQQAGFTGGMALLALSGRKGVEAELAKQAGRSSISDTAAANSERLARASISLGQGTAAEAGMKGVEVFGGAQAAAREKSEAAAEWAAEFGVTAVTAVKDFAGSVTEAAKSADGFTKSAAMLTLLSGNLVGATAILARGAGGTPDWGKMSAAQRKAALDPVIKSAAAQYGVDPDILSGIARTESTYNPATAASPTGARGVMQIQPTTGADYGHTPGVDYVADIKFAAMYLAEQLKQAKAAGYSGKTADVMAVAAYHSGFRGVREGVNIGSDSRAYPDKVLGSIPGYDDALSGFRFGDGSQVDMQVDTINIHTQATDADGIAENIAGAMQRKMMTAQADGGPQ